MTEKTMSLFINNTWGHEHGRHWIAKALGFSENGNDVTISSCHGTPEIAYKRLIAGMKELARVDASGVGRIGLLAEPTHPKHRPQALLLSG